MRRTTHESGAGPVADRPARAGRTPAVASCPVVGIRPRTHASGAVPTGGPGARWTAAIVASAAVLGCASGGVYGAGERPGDSPAADVSTRAPDSLAGVWRGTYRGRTYRRSGTLEVSFAGRGAPGVGAVVIGGVPADRPPASTRAGPPVRVALQTAAAGERVSFRTEPYFDSGCGCTVTLAFVGRARGDTLEGRFTGRSAATVTAESRGQWRLVRQPR